MTQKELVSIIRKAVRLELKLFFAEQSKNTQSAVSENINQSHSHYINENLNTLRSQMQNDIQSLYGNAYNDNINNVYEMIPDSIVGDSADIPIDKQSAISALQNTTQGRAVLNALTTDYSSMFKK